VTDSVTWPEPPVSGDGRASWPPVLIGQARIIDMAFHGQDLVPLITSLTERANRDPNDAAALMDLAFILVVLQKRDEALALQREALGIERVYRQPIHAATGERLRVLMFAGPGDFMANIPIQFLLEGSEIALDVLYVDAGQPLPNRVPDHDLALVGVAESDESRPTLDAVSSLAATWPRRVLIDPRKIAMLSRESLWGALAGAPGVLVPATVRIDRGVAARLSGDEGELGRVLAGARYPIILRPVGSHAGRGLQKIESPGQLSGYLAEQPAATFYVSPFVDYRSVDGLFRKYRIAVVDGRPFACHMAMADRWMLHYLNAGMEQSAEKRAEEAAWFETFDTVFAERHRRAFRALHERIGLEYFVIDCAETPGGDLLLFEADTAMVVHSMDSPDLFPYKRPQMLKVFGAFQDMLRAHAR
jgi:hypothetical protein